MNTNLLSVNPLNEVTWNDEGVHQCLPVILVT